jgi:hypothetical protein
LNLFYDVRPTIAEIDSPAPPYTNSASLSIYAPYIGKPYPLANGGGRGDGQFVFVSPQLEDVSNYYGTGTDGIDENIAILNPAYDYSQNDFYLYAEFLGTAGEIASSVGVTQSIPAAAFTGGNGFYLASAAATPMTATLWDGTNFAGSNASISMKMVQVPVTAGPAFDNDAAYLNPGDTEQVAKVHIQAEYRLTETAPYYNGGDVADIRNYSLGVKLAVNELLVTRVSYPTAAAVLPVYLGYDNAGALELWGNGTSTTGTNPTDDMSIIVVRKGDYDFDGGAASGVDDYAYYSIGADPTNVNPLEWWLGDFDGFGDGPNTGLDDVDYFRHANIP